MVRLFLAFLTLYALQGVPLVRAESTDLKVRILSKDCVFDIIDSGTQQLLYYTPEACGLPPDTVPAPTSTTSDKVPTQAERFDAIIENIEDAAGLGQLEPKVDREPRTENGLFKTDVVVLGAKFPIWLILSLLGCIILAWLFLGKKRSK